MSSGIDMSAFMATQLKEQMQENRKLREEVVEAKMQAVKANAESERIREELTPQEAVSDQQISALQARLEALHEAKLLTEDECFSMEDLCADFLELKASVGAVTVSANEFASKLLKLIALSEGIEADGRFARQARRKFAQVA